ncbi:hypothetical protein KP509_14G091200 [Ceratopteris richardii]|uniref:Uncharacterized protein n=1 Tax=Ceratopteris richardii TaxID=49495 RepID=A0A8T2THE6_CERRI|nr:hypothetical protein KP509_14G091200 [Ceratopteris richardii]
MVDRQNTTLISMNDRRNNVPCMETESTVDSSLDEFSLLSLTKPMSFNVKLTDHSPQLSSGVWPLGTRTES